MTTRTRTRALVPVERVIVGDPAAVRAALETAAGQGRLVAASRRKWLADGRLVVDAQLLEPSRSRVRSAPVIVGLVAIGTVGALVVAGWLLVAWVVAHATAIIGGAVVVAVLLAMLVGSGKCPGIHCPGCSG